MSQSRTNTRTTLTHMALGAALALAAAALWASPTGTGATAHAAPAKLPNASAQRLDMVRSLKSIDERLAVLEKTLTDGELVVKVSEMPTIKVEE